jgi:hypothetical protein
VCARVWCVCVCVKDLQTTVQYWNLLKSNDICPFHLAAEL